jgi:aminomethyltransferase
MRRTILNDTHRKHGAKMVEFAGWEMPVEYQGIRFEHLAVRERAGIFDVSHMGRIEICGKDAEPFLDYLSTNKIKGKKDGSATYTVFCRETGGAVDDLIVYRQTQELFFVVVNASNREKDLHHLQEMAKNFDVATVPKYDEEGILAIQGPLSKGIVGKRFPESASLSLMHFKRMSYEGYEFILSATGYTGEAGFEIYAPLAIIPNLWEMFLSDDVEPVGLGARDTLRLEMGYALYGHELSEDIAPTESVSSWTVKWEGRDFLGKAALEKLEGSPQKRQQAGIIMQEPGIAREGYPVFREGKPIGKVTSGTMSPTLNQAIAIIMVAEKLCVGENVDVEIRGKKRKAEVVKLPFLKEVKG